MKQVITFCLLLAITFNVNAQVKKVIKKPVASTVAVPAPKIPQETAKVPSGPTKDETVEQIKDFFKGHYTEIDIPTGYLTTSKDYTFDIDNTVITIKYKSWDGSPPGRDVSYDDKLLSFDLKEIGKVAITSRKTTSKGCSYFISFSSKKNTIQTENEKTNYALLPLYGRGIFECDSDLSEEEILQTINHLRKLCGESN